ncbi:MAG: hypothetical protein CMK00_07230 [Planctomycetes bacterium]|nr:hypothetical protein [Planctomycetota bacterium]
MTPSAALRRSLSLKMACLGLLCGVAPEAGAGAQDNRSSRSDYVIEARVDGERHELSGRETITWTNRSGDRVSDLAFHLYLNAFSGNRSTHLAESKGRLRGRKVENEWGWQRVERLVVDGQDVTASLRYAQPDDGNEEDRTVLLADLPAPVVPGGSIEIELEWSSLLPRVRRRTGHAGDFYFAAQWFPKLGVYEGGQGWNCHQFHASTEFYADYGTFDVTLDLPARFENKVGASGVQAGPPIVSGDRVLTRFLAPSLADRKRRDNTGKLALVHDFAWTADPAYSVFKKTFHYDEWAQRFPEEVTRTSAALGREPATLSLRPVDVTVLIHPERWEQRERHYEATATALFFYGLWFGEYPYEHITVVDPSWSGRAAGGMEYPTIFTCGTRLFTEPDMYTPEGVTVHEAGHQFWYGLVGNNEFEAAWLDEGFNSYADSEALVRRYGPSRATTTYASIPIDGVPMGQGPGGGELSEILSARRWKLPLDIELEPLHPNGFVDYWRDQPALAFATRHDDPRWADRAGYLRDPDSDPVDMDAWTYVDRQSYRTNSYPRPAVILRSMAGVFGEEAFMKGMRHYSESWRYRHPYPEDFFQAFGEGAGIDASWYFADLFQSTKTVDWSVEVSQVRVAEARGWVQASPGVPFELISDEPEEEDEDGDGEKDGDKGDGRSWEVEILLRRQGELRLPLEVELTFAGGRTERHTWTRAEQQGVRWKRITLTSAEKLKSAVIDPERGIYLDLDMSDNQWFDETEKVTATRWTERVFSRYAHLLHFFEGIGG